MYRDFECGPASVSPPEMVHSSGALLGPNNWMSHSGLDLMRPAGVPVCEEQVFSSFLLSGMKTL